MIHVAALPGTPANRLSVGEIAKQSVNEARLFIKHGVDALLIENMHDRPYLNRGVNPEITAAMTAVAVGMPN